MLRFKLYSKGGRGHLIRLTHSRQNKPLSRIKR